MTDSLSYALLAVAVAGVAHRRDGLVSLATLIGVFNRETALFVVPVWFAMNLRNYSPARLTIRAALVFGPALVGYVLLHHTPLFFGHFPAHINYLRPDNMSAIWNSNLSWLGTGNVSYGLAICVFLAYGPVWFLAIYGFISALFRGDEDVKPLMSLFALAIPTALALSVTDWRRGFQPIFPAVIAAAVVGLRGFTADLPRTYWYLAAIGTILSANFTTEAWWSRKISLSVASSMLPWMALMTFILSRHFAHLPIQSINRLISVDRLSRNLFEHFIGSSRKERS